MICGAGLWMVLIQRISARMPALNLFRCVSSSLWPTAAARGASDVGSEG